MLKEHERHLKLVLDALTKAEFYLERDKCNLYVVRLDCLGHMINKRGVHADTDKMARICEWRTPRNLTEIQRFVGLVKYLAQFMPDVSAYTTHKHTEEWSHIPLVRDPRSLFPGDQGSCLQIPNIETNKSCLERANLAHLRCIPVRSRRALWSERGLEDISPSWVHVEKADRYST